MARKSTTKTTQKQFSKLKFTLTNSQKLVLGSFLVILGILLFIALLSYLFTGESDQSVLGDFTNRTVETNNWLSKVGAWVSELLIYKGFGISSFLFSGLLFLSGISVLINSSKKRLWRNWFWGTLVIIWGSILFGFAFEMAPKLGGVIGFELNLLLQDYVGKIGTALLLIFCFIVYIALRFKVGPQQIAHLFVRTKKELQSELSEENDSSTSINESISEENDSTKSAFEVSLENLEPTISNHSSIYSPSDLEVNSPTEEPSVANKNEEAPLEMKIEASVEELSETDNLASKLVEDFGEVDPTLELSKFKFPSLDLLKQYDSEGITINQEELEENKNKIVETLNNYKIGIANIKATIGPTVTLYEIIPEAGVRISKIKNLEDDIALSLSALGIRIIAPIPGRGTIGIEVPNKNATIVSMHSVIASQKFQKSEMELPIALGKTISNETYVVDLAKMPHLLMAGATGQGKSVGLNAVLTSLLYKKHPAEVKFVLVDPKKVELTLFNKIERHYLAKLPDR